MIRNRLSVRSFRTLLLLVVAVLLNAASVYAQTRESAAANATQESILSDSLRADSLAVDSLGSDTLRNAAGVDIVTLADSAKLKLDSAAVAAISDTSQALPSSLSGGTDVLFFGRPIFKVFGPLGELSVEQRTERITQRLEQLAGNQNASMDSLSVVDGQEFSTIQLGEVIVMTITDAESKALLIPRNRVAVDNAEIIQQEVARYREQLTVKGLIRSVIISVVLFVVLMILLRLLGWFYGQLDKRTLKVRNAIIRPVVFRGNILVSRAQIENVANWVFRMVRLAISIILIYIFLTSVFGLFPWTQAWSERLLSYAIAPLAAFGRMIVDGAPNLLAIGVIVVVVRWMIKTMSYFFNRIAHQEFHVPGIPPELAEPTRRIVRFLLIVVGAMLIYPYTPIAGSQAFQGLTVFFGIMLSLGSSSAISNIIAGVVLTYTRAFRLGDRVKMGDTFGDVIEKTFLITRIRTPKNEDIAVPNSMALSSHIINYSEMCRDGEGVILHSTVTIGYDVPWPRVHELLLEAADATEGLKKEPLPFVLQNSLGDFSVAYQINAYTEEVNKMAGLYSNLHANIQDAFNRAEIEILSPIYNAFRDGNALTNPDRPDLGPSAAAVSAGADGGS